MKAARALADGFSILRFHIIGIAVMAALTFGWLLVGRFPIGVALLGGVDWLLINLLNRITDVDEDAVNEVRGTEIVARNLVPMGSIWLAILVGSFVAGVLWVPELTVVRIIVQLIGLGYSVAIVPTPGGWKRFKEIYFLKNFMSAVLFVLTAMVYPVVASAWETVLPGRAALSLMVFFVPFELTYEIFYDMRDLDGDRCAGVPTYPVVHGLQRSRAIVDNLLLFSGLVLACGFLARLIGIREVLMAAAPAIQFFYYRPRFWAGLPSNVYL
jgi:4-hydroxybenzoate polyprenyltransferase